MKLSAAFNLKDLLRDSDFQKIQDEIAIATNVAIITVDYSGTPITKHSSCSAFCRRIRKDSNFRTLCEKCDSRGGVEAARVKKPYIYLCHMNIVDFAIPIIIDGVYVGALMAGQLMVPEEDRKALENIVSNRNTYFLDEELKLLYQSLPKMSLEKIKALSNIISYLIHSYVREMSKTGVNEVESIAIDSIDINSKSRQIINPAIAYIERNYNHSISLNQIADMCKVSSSYLSRLFKKVAGCNYAYYVNRVRINNAKRLLISSTNSVASIALELGYEDSGYFIKVFKKLENMTPNEYRNSYRA